VHSIKDSKNEAGKDTGYDETIHKLVLCLINKERYCEGTYGIEVKFHTHSCPQHKFWLRNQFHASATLNLGKNPWHKTNKRMGGPVSQNGCFSLLRNRTVIPVPSNPSSTH